MKRKSSRPHANPSDNHPEDEPLDEGAATFDWEFASDDRGGTSPSAAPRATRAASTPRDRGADGQRAGQQQRQSWRAHRSAATALPRGGRFGDAHANYIRQQLDYALERWWAQGEMPSLDLLRNGLLLLESGGSVSESQRTLLLRAALAYDRGVQTALRHQSDAERVGLVLAEALVEWEPPLSPERVARLLTGDALAGDQDVIEALITELERSRLLLTGEARHRAEVALEELPRLLAQGEAPPSPPYAPQGSNNAQWTPRPFRQILFVLLLVAVLGFVLWQQRRAATPAGMVAMPTALYYLTDVDGGLVSSEPTRLDAFFIDRFEVTNREYRVCVERGACLWPVQTSSATRSDYFTDPAFDEYPVVNVTQSMAASYCAWQGKRLPSAAEWQVAAGVSPTTGQPFRFPWGENFEPQRTNSAATNFGDTLAVGSFRPGGNSPSGASDMAGNVAEWTVTLVQGMDATKEYAVVKGGSYASAFEALIVGAEMHIEVDSASPEIGFRCARTRPVS